MSLLTQLRDEAYRKLGLEREAMEVTRVGATLNRAAASLGSGPPGPVSEMPAEGTLRPESAIPFGLIALAVAAYFVLKRK